MLAVIASSSLRPTPRAGGQGQALPSFPGIQRLWRVLLLGFSCQVPPLPLTPAVRWFQRICRHWFSNWLFFNRLCCCAARRCRCPAVDGREAFHSRRLVGAEKTKLSANWR